MYRIITIRRLTPMGIVVLTCLMGFIAWITPQAAFAQYEYRIGKGQASIEPGKQILSVTLAGYGAPREGRFSLEWKPIATHGMADDAAIVSDRLYMLRDGGIRYVDLANPENEPKSMDQLENISTIASYDNGLLAVTEDNQLLIGRISRKGTWRWRNQGTLHQSLRSVSYWKGQLVALDVEGKLWTAADGLGTFIWNALPDCAGVIDVMASGEHLYVLTNAQEILRYEPSSGWLRVAIQNGLTYTQDIRLLLASDNGFWGLDRTGTLYTAQHSTTNNLLVNALAVQRGKKRLVILGVDVCGLDGRFVDMVKQDIREKFGIQPSAILINASHTHFGPVSQLWLTWGPHCQRPDSTYLYSIVRSGIFNAVQQAMEQLKPAKLFFGRSEVEIGHNRSLPGADQPYDKTLDVIRIDYENIEEDDIVFLAGCHPVFQNAGKEGLTISPNYPGVARDMLVHHSTVRSAMFLQGCGGDINPIDADHRITAKKVASAVSRMLDSSEMRLIQGDISFYLDTVTFNSRPWMEPEILEFRKANEGKEGDVGAEKNVRWADLMLKHHAEGTMPSTMPVFVQTLNIGNWKLVGISRETTTEYSLGVKELWSDKLVTVAGYCNDVSSYLPTSRHIKAHTYEGYDSFFWYGQPNIFPENVYETIIASIKQKNR